MILKRQEVNSGGYFQSVEVLEINIYLQEENLCRTKWKNGVPSIRKCINNI